VDEPDGPAAADQWDRALAAAEATFSLALALVDMPPPTPGREQGLVQMALEAGVLGVLYDERGGRGRGDADGG
jgi:hypothetical protein